MSQPTGVAAASTVVPYGRQTIEQVDVDAVVAVLRSDWLTTGPTVSAFEQSFAEFVGADHAIAVSNGTAALHLCVLAADIGPGDEVIVPSMTFAASANCARFAGATVVFADVRPDTLTIDPAHAESLITPRTRAIVAVDYAGVPADLAPLLTLAERHGLVLIEDACHAPGARYGGALVGSIAHLTAFSFHPVKHLTTAEGGMITSNDAGLAGRARRLRNHGIDTDFRQREHAGTWEYDMVELGYNYRLPDLNCALGLAQLTRLDEWVMRRRAIADRYAELFAGHAGVHLPVEPPESVASWHLYPVRVQGDDPAESRSRAFTELRANGIGVNVHYRPVHLHTYYRDLGYSPGLTPVAEQAYHGLLSLPMWPGLSDTDQDRVVDLLLAAIDV